MEFADLLSLVYGIGRVLIWSLLPALVVRMGVKFLSAARNSQNPVGAGTQPQNPSEKVSDTKKVCSED